MVDDLRRRRPAPRIRRCGPCPASVPYTARAVRVFAFGEDVAAVDTNARAGAGTRRGRSADHDAPRPADSATAWCPSGPVVGVQPGDVRPRRHGLHAGPTRRATLPPPPAVRLASDRADAGRPDPWRARPATRRQGTFAGSDRQGRGRLLDALRHGGVRRADLARLWGGRRTPSAPGGWPRRWSPRASPTGPAVVARSSGCVEGGLCEPAHRRRRAVKAAPGAPG